MARPTNLKNKDNQDVIIYRQELVASLRARGLSLREIQVYLASIDPKTGQPRLLNPSTGEPFDIATLSRDLKKLRQASVKRAQESADEIRAQQLAEVREAKRSAWSQQNLPMVARFLEVEMKLTGTAMPDKKEINWAEEQLKQMMGDARESLATKLGALFVADEAHATSTE